MQFPPQRRGRDNTPPFWSLWSGRKVEDNPPEELKGDFLQEEALPFLTEMMRKFLRKKE